MMMVAQFIWSSTIPNDILYPDVFHTTPSPSVNGNIRIRVTGVENLKNIYTPSIY